MSDPQSPEVVVLPGLDGTGQLSAAFIAALHAHGLAAHTRPLPVEGPQDYPTLAAQLQPLLPSQPFVLLAESFAGPLAIELAARRPAALRALVLCATFARRPVPLPAAAAVALSATWPMPPLPWMARLLLGRWRTADNQQALRGALAQVSPQVLRLRAAATLRVDARAALRRMDVPTLYLQALQDRLLWPPSVHELQSLLPDARQVALEGPHLLLQACPASAAAVVARWIKALPG